MEENMTNGQQKNVYMLHEKHVSMLQVYIRNIYVICIYSWEKICVACDEQRG